MQATEDMSLALVPAAPTSMGLVRPLVDPRAAQLAIREYEALKSAIVQPGDIQKIQGRDFLKKSFWRRVATCFGLSLELVSEDRMVRDGVLSYSAIYRAIAPNGRTMTGDGYCDSAEKRGVPEHNIRAIAHTRAKNRAISDLVGGGEVSAEEMADYVDAEPVQAAARTQQTTRATQARTASAKPASAGAWNPLGDREFRGIMSQLGYRSVDQVEGWIERDGHGISRENAMAEAHRELDSRTVDADGPDLHELGTVRG